MDVKNTVIVNESELRS